MTGGKALDLMRVTIDLRKDDRRIVYILAAAYPNHLTKAQIVERMYCDREDGGPLTAWAIVSVRISKIRKQLEGTNWTIPVNKGSTSRYILKHKDDR